MLDGLLAHFGYLAILALLTGAGLGVPVPEEPTQLAAGALAQRGFLSLAPAMAVCWVGIVAGDFLWFLLARRVGPAVLDRRPLRRLLTPDRRARLERHLARHAFLTVMVCRHLSGLRLPAFALVATHGVRRRTFALADGLSASLSVPLVVSAGYLGSRHLAQVRDELRRVELAALAAVAVAAVVVVVVRRLRLGRARDDAARRGA